jgi:hypothetical protein
MGRQIKITSNEIEVIAGIDDSETANRIWEALPIESSVSTWGEEIYFAIPVQIEESDDARQDMDIGELGYWPPGSALCIFFGRTPASTSDQPRAASNVNPFGMVSGDMTSLHSIRQGDRITVSRVEEG